ncbi:YegP family protein [Flavobacterium sp.]|uniref:YegP family protein n=1 Tax=Flavobacterium sp. TaxID=239 RepID=UPI0040346E71
MGMFVISKRDNGDFKFTFNSRRGKTIFTGMACKEKEFCHLMIAEIRENIATLVLTKNKTAAGKYFFRLSKDGLVIATSRKYGSEYAYGKGISEIMKYVTHADTLDFSENEFVFPDAEEVFSDAE